MLVRMASSTYAAVFHADAGTRESGGADGRKMNRPSTASASPFTSTDVTAAPPCNVTAAGNSMPGASAYQGRLGAI